MISFNPEVENQVREALLARAAESAPTPEDQEMVGDTPGETISNISPWREHTGLWRANPGNDPNFVPNTPLEPHEEDNS